MICRNRNPHKKIKRQVPFEGKIAGLETIVNEKKYNIVEDSCKKNITLLIDVSDWAFSNISKQIVKYKDTYNFNIVVARDLLRETNENRFKYFLNSDIILCFYWVLYKDFNKYFPKNARKGIGIFNLATLTSENSKSFLEQADFLFIANKKFLELTNSMLPNKTLYLTEDGVDPELFKNKNKIIDDEYIKFIWAGNSSHGNDTKENYDLKGYQEILVPLSKYIENKGGKFIFVDRASGKTLPHEKMCDVYNMADCFVCASKAEGTPNGILEAAACGRISLTTDVGLVPELIKDKYNGLIAERNLQAFEDAVDWIFENKSKIKKMSSKIQQDIKQFYWQNKVESYYELFDKEITINDLNKLESINTTAFLISVGLEQKETSLKLLKQQNSNILINHIENISPMNKAFQEMINRCQTKYFIQVDEDMFLNSNATSKMITAMENSKPDVAMIVYPLFDSHLNKIIQGVKIYRTEAMKKISFEESYSCEVPIIKKLEDNGYRFEQLPLESKYVLGTHEIGENPRVVYERYFRLAQKWKKYGYYWVPEAAKDIKNRILTNSCEKRDFWAISGFIAGSVMSPGDDKELDFNELPSGLVEIKKMFKVE